MGWCGSGRYRGRLLPLATPPSPILCFQSTDRGHDRQRWEMREREDSEDAWLQSALACMKVLVAQYCPTLCNSMNCSLPGSFVHGILQVRILEWVAIPFSRGSFPSRDQSQVSCIASSFLTVWATREALAWKWHKSSFSESPDVRSAEDLRSLGLDTSSSPEHLLQQADVAAILLPRGNGRGRWLWNRSISVWHPLCRWQGFVWWCDGCAPLVNPGHSSLITTLTFFFPFLLLLPPVVRQRVTSTSSGCWGQMARSGSGSWEKVLVTSPMKRSLRSWLQRERGCRRSGKPRNSGERCQRVLWWGEGAGAWTRRLGVGSN